VRYVQSVVRDGDDLILVLAAENGHVLSKRTWKGAAGYVRPAGAPKGYICLMVPERVGLDIKGATQGGSPPPGAPA